MVVSGLKAHGLFADGALVDDQVFVAVTWLALAVVVVMFGLTVIALVLHWLGILHDNVARLWGRRRSVADVFECELCWIERIACRLFRLYLFAVFFGRFLTLTFEDVRLDLENASFGVVEGFLVDVACLSVWLDLNDWILEWTVLKLTFGDSVLSAVGQSLCDRNTHYISWSISWSCWLLTGTKNYFNFIVKWPSVNYLRWLLSRAFKVDRGTVVIEVLELLRSTNGVAAVVVIRRFGVWLSVAIAAWFRKLEVEFWSTARQLRNKCFEFIAIRLHCLLIVLRMASIAATVQVSQFADRSGKRRRSL